jgi:hypothetical protein
MNPLTHILLASAAGGLLNLRPEALERPLQPRVGAGRHGRSSLMSESTSP